MKQLLAIFIVLTPLFSATAAEFYRDNPPPYRFMGSDQGNVGSCEAEADVAALESVFWEMGRQVKLSSFHRHAFNWVNDNVSDPKYADDGLKLAYTNEDKEVLGKMGGVVPYYMLPDATFGFNPFDTGVRIGISKVIVSDPNYKGIDVKKEYYTFNPNYSNTRKVDDLKSAVANNTATLLSFSPVILNGDAFDHTTGLLRKGTNLEDYAKKDSSHSVSVIGYDDSLYSDYGFSRPGAIIIKNSWNSKDRIVGSLDPNLEVSKEDFNKMRGKISQVTNLPGYYAIPYALIDLFVDNKKDVGFRLLFMDYPTFADQYDALMDNFEVIAAPYKCGPDLANASKYTNAAKKGVLAFGDLMNQAMYKQSIGQDYSDETAEIMAKLRLQLDFKLDYYEESPEKLSFTFLSRHETSGVDRIADFYQGKFNDYYCFSGRTEFNDADHIYPNINHYNDSRYNKALTELSADVFSLTNWWFLIQALYNTEVDSHVDVEPQS